MHRFVNGATDGHDLSHRFHRCGEVGLGARELLEGKLRNFGDNVVDAWLKACWRHFGDVVVELIKRVANSELGRDLGDRETCSL